jgi:hypothetical protein
MRSIDLIVRVIEPDRPDELEACLTSLFRQLPELADRLPRLTAVKPCGERPDIDAVLHRYVDTAPAMEVITTGAAPAGRGVLSSLLRRSAADRRDALVLTSDTLWFEGSLRALVEAGDVGEGVGLVSPCTAERGVGIATAAQQRELADRLPRHVVAADCLAAAHLVTWPLLRALCAAQPDPAELLALGTDLAPEARRWGHAVLVAHRAVVSCRPGMAGTPATVGADHGSQGMAYAMLGALLPRPDGRWSLVVDWCDTAGHHGDGSSLQLRAIRALAAAGSDGPDVGVLCPHAVFRFHGLDRCHGVRHVDPANPGRHTVALRMTVPDSPAALALHHRLAPLSVCVAPWGLVRLEAPDHPGHAVWKALSRHADAVLFTSADEQACFDALQPAGHASRSRLLPWPVALGDYRKDTLPAVASHVLVMGDDAETMAERLRTGFGDLPIVCLGHGTSTAPGLCSRRADATSPDTVHDLISRSHAVVHTTASGACADSVLQVLAAGKPLVAPWSAGLQALLGRYRSVRGVFLHDDVEEAPALLRLALAQGRSETDDEGAPSWSDWAAGLLVVVDRLRRLPDVLSRVEARLEVQQVAGTAPYGAAAPPRAGAIDLDHLLAHDGRDFVQMAYWTFLNRAAEAEGEGNFLYALNSGQSKLEVIDIIQGSPEGGVVGARLRGYVPLARSDDARPKRIVLVLGMHRSGTSALTRGLQVLGVELGNNLYPPRPGENPKGYFEDADISNFDDQLLASIGRDWQHHGRLDTSLVDELRRNGMHARAVELLRAKCKGKAVLGVKDPRISKLLPFWQPVFDELGLDQSFVVALRNPKSVARSLAVRNGFPHEKSYLLWLEHTLDSLAVLGKHRCAFTDYDALLADPGATIRSVARELDLYVNAADLHAYASEFLDRDLRHAEYDGAALVEDPACSPLVREVYGLLHRVAMDNSLAESRAFAQTVVGWQQQIDSMRAGGRSVDRLRG